MMALSYEQYSEMWRGCTVYDCKVLCYVTWHCTGGSHSSVHAVAFVLLSASFHLVAASCPAPPVEPAVLACNEHSPTVMYVGYTTKQCCMHSFWFVCTYVCMYGCILHKCVHLHVLHSVCSAYVCTYVPDPCVLLEKFIHGAPVLLLCLLGFLGRARYIELEIVRL